MASRAGAHRRRGLEDSDREHRCVSEFDAFERGSLACSVEDGGYKRLAFLVPVDVLQPPRVASVREPDDEVARPLEQLLQRSLASSRKDDSVSEDSSIEPHRPWTGSRLDARNGHLDESVAPLSHVDPECPPRERRVESIRHATRYAWLGSPIAPGWSGIPVTPRSRSPRPAGLVRAALTSVRQRGSISRAVSVDLVSLGQLRPSRPDSSPGAASAPPGREERGQGSPQGTKSRERPAAHTHG